MEFVIAAIGAVAVLLIVIGLGYDLPEKDEYNDGLLDEFIAGVID